MLITLENMHLLSWANNPMHWSNKRRITQGQLREIDLLHRKQIKQLKLPLEVYLYRIGPQMLDTDNLPNAFKHIRDYLASQLLPLTQANQHGRRGDDSDPRIAWHYGQRLGKHCVEIRFVEVQA